MGLKHQRFGNVIVNFWHGAVTVDEIQSSIDQARAANQMHGPITGLSVCSRDLEFPAADVNKHMAANRSVMLSYHLSMHMVLPKGHFKGMRIAMYVVSVLTLGTSREVAHHATVAAALAEGASIRARERQPAFLTKPEDILLQLERLKIPLT